MQAAMLSTAHVPSSQRLDYWNGITSSLFPGTSVDGPEDLIASLQSVCLGDTHICIAKAPESKVRRGIAEMQSSGVGRAHFLFQMRGLTHAIQHRANVICSAGELTVCESNEVYELEVSKSNECLIVDCPEGDLPFRPLIGKSISAINNVHVSLLMPFLQNIMLQPWNDDILDSEEEEHLEDALLQLLRNCLTSSQFSSTKPDTNLRSANTKEIYERAVKLIGQYIHDSSIRTGVIAKRLSVSELCVQKAFAQFGTTPTNYILGRRLDLARMHLEDPGFKGSLTDLAHELGFSDSAHFSRRFKARFKTSPSLYQKNKRIQRDSLS